jgi:4-phytase/acid phosphatase
MRLAALVLALMIPIAGTAQSRKLEYVVVLSRHGVRSPTVPASDLRQYSAEPWPEWSVAPGELTEHGRKAITILGGWYRDWFAHDGLLPETGCDSSKTVHVRADVDQRTRESGRALAQGLFPDCPPEVHVTDSKTDPLFHPVAAGGAHGDGAVSVASVAGRIGRNPVALADVYAQAFQALNEVLGKQSLLALPASVQATSDGLADIRGPLRTGSTLAENLFLEYAEGMSGKDLGWGRLDGARLHEVMAIHTAYADLARRTPYLAGVQGSNLLQHILLSMEQAVSGKPVAGALGSAGDRVLILAGHDSNISHISGMLNLSWLVPGYQRDDTPPGGSLVFRLWRGPDPKTYSVELLYIAQTVDQIRNASALDRNSPPAIALVFLPGCKQTGAQPDCEWENFRRVLSSAIDPLKTLP